jgi:hypothetical protein
LKHEKSTLEFRISTNAEISQACRFWSLRLNQR